VPGAPHTPSPGPGGPDGGDKKNRKRKGKKDGEDGQNQQQGGNQNQNQGGNQNQKRKEKGERGERAANGERERGEDAGAGGPSIEVTPVNGGEDGAAPNGKLHNGNGNGTLYIPPPDLTLDGESPLTSGLDGALDPAAKKARNLNKKLKAIEELKEKAKRGERLEATQLKKMEGEAEIRRELAGLGV